MSKHIKFGEITKTNWRPDFMADRQRQGALKQSLEPGAVRAASDTLIRPAGAVRMSRRRAKAEAARLALDLDCLK